MKFLSLVALSTTVLGGVIYDRDIATIKGVMSDVGTNLVGLDTSVKGFSGDPSDLLKASNTLIQTLKDGKTKVDPLPNLSLVEALGLQDPVKDLQAKGDTLVADLKAAKDKFAAAGLCEVTFQQASSINVASNDLINAVVAKVPADAQGIAKSLTAPLVKALQDAQDLFSPANCKNSGTPPPVSSPPVSSPGGSPTATATPTQTKPGTTPTAPGTTQAPPTTTATPPPGNTDTCPPAQTVVVTVTDSSDCTTKKPTCTTKAPVTTTTTKKACPTNKLPW